MCLQQQQKQQQQWVSEQRKKNERNTTSHRKDAQHRLPGRSYVSVGIGVDWNVCVCV